MFTRTSLGLLRSAAKSDATAQRAFALAQAAQAAQAAQTKADKARELAGLAEAKERVVELSKEEVAARLILASTSATHMAALADRNTAQGSYEASKKTVNATQAALFLAEGNLSKAKEVATNERNLLKTSE